MVYSLRNLSSYDFELLTRDLLQAHLGVTLESFAQGRDGGIDLRAIATPDASVIVQCKHYANSTYAALRKSLTDEVPKLNQIAAQGPIRFVVATSRFHTA